MHLLDANAFMEANRLYYAFDIAPGFWTWLSDSSLAGQVASIDAIRDEITAGSGELVEWARALPSTFWLPDSDDVVTAMTELAAWSTDPSRSFRQAAVDEFFGSADLKLIAHAMASGAAVVTRERSEPESKKKIKIPRCLHRVRRRLDRPVQRIPIPRDAACRVASPHARPALPSMREHPTRRDSERLRHRC